MTVADFGLRFSASTLQPGPARVVGVACRVVAKWRWMCVVEPVGQASSLSPFFLRPCLHKVCAIGFRNAPLCAPSALRSRDSVLECARPSAAFGDLAIRPAPNSSNTLKSDVMVKPRILAKPAKSSFNCVMHKETRPDRPELSRT